MENHVKGFRKVHHYCNFKTLQLLPHKVFMTQNEQLQTQASQSELCFCILIRFE